VILFTIPVPPPPWRSPLNSAGEPGHTFIRAPSYFIDSARLSKNLLRGRGILQKHCAWICCKHRHQIRYRILQRIDRVSRRIYRGSRCRRGFGLGLRCCWVWTIHNLWGLVSRLTIKLKRFRGVRKRDEGVVSKRNWTYHHRCWLRSFGLWYLNFCRYPNHQCSWLYYYSYLDIKVSISSFSKFPLNSPLQQNSTLPSPLSKNRKNTQKLTQSPNINPIKNHIRRIRNKMIISRTESQIQTRKRRIMQSNNTQKRRSQN